MNPYRLFYKLYGMATVIVREFKFADDLEKFIDTLNPTDHAWKVYAYKKSTDEWVPMDIQCAGVVITMAIDKGMEIIIDKFSD